MRISDEHKRKHWCLKWASKNPPAVAAIMVLFDHVKQDLSCLDHNQCLLAEPKSFLKATSNQEANMEGCYLYYDNNNDEWIRSGKATGSNFGKRHQEHKRGSNLSTVESRKSKFYSSYPSKQVHLADHSSRRGYFEKLEMFVGISCCKLMKGKLTDDFTRQRGIFHFDEETLKHIGRVNFSGNSRVQAKQLHMLGYLWELACDLALAPQSNISGNPGFETVLGIY